MSIDAKQKPHIIQPNPLLHQQEVKTFTTVDELEAFILKHGENIVDLMGGEIDRIEIKLRVNRCNGPCILHIQIKFASFSIFQKKFPEIRHCDLEIL